MSVRKECAEDNEKKILGNTHIYTGKWKNKCSENNTFQFYLLYPRTNWFSVALSILDLGGHALAVVATNPTWIMHER